MTSIAVSFSEISDFQTCTRLWWYKYVLRLRPRSVSSAIKRGHFGHDMLRQFYESMQKHGNVAQAEQEMYSVLPEYKTEEMLTAYTLIRKYIEKDFDPRYTAIFSEKRFFVPIDDEVVIAIRPDLVLSYRDRLTSEDYKFIGRNWSSKKTIHAKQLDVYNIYLQEAGRKVSYSQFRFFNTSTFDIKVIPRHPDPERMKTVKREIEAVARKIAALRLKHDNDPVAIEQEVNRTFNVNTCQYCAFDFPCLMAMEGKSAERTLAQDYVKDTEYAYIIANN